MIRGTKATICPRNGNRSPAEPGNEIRAGPRPSFPRGRIDLNVRRERRDFSTVSNPESVPEFSKRLRQPVVYILTCAKMDKGGGFRLDEDLFTW